MEDFNTWTISALVHEINELEDLKSKQNSLNGHYTNPQIQEEINRMYDALEKKVLKEIAKEKIKQLLVEDSNYNGRVIPS